MSTVPILKGETPIVEQIARDTGCAWMGDDDWLGPRERWSRPACARAIVAISLVLWGIILAAVAAGLL